MAIMREDVTQKIDPATAMIASAIIGGLFGMGDKEQKTETKWSPPDYINTDDLSNIQAQYKDIIKYWADKDMSWPGQFAMPLTQEQIDAAAALRGQMIPNFINQEKFLYQDAAQNNALMNALQGNLGEMQNPYATPSNPYLESMWQGYRGDVNSMTNPMATASSPYLNGLFKGYTGDVAGLTNEFGEATNPALENAITAMRSNAEKTFNRTTGAATDAAMAQQGAFGGSAYNEFKNAQSKELADTLGLQEAGMRNEQMNRALATKESALGRQYGSLADVLKGQLGQYGLAANLTENALGRQFNAANQELGQRFGQYQNAGLGQENVFQRQMQALGLMPQMETSDANIAGKLFGVGEVSRGLDQQQLEGEIARYNQNVMQPMMMTDWWRSGLQNMMGPGNQTMTQTTPGDWFSGALGGAALGKYAANQGWLSNLFNPNPVPQTYNFTDPGTYSDDYFKWPA